MFSASDENELLVQLYLKWRETGKHADTYQDRRTDFTQNRKARNNCVRVHHKTEHTRFTQSVDGEPNKPESFMRGWGTLQIVLSFAAENLSCN